VQMSLQHRDVISFGYIPRNGIARSNGSSGFNFLRRLHTVFHNDCVPNCIPSIMTVYQIAFPATVCKRPSLCILASTCYLIFLIAATLTGVR
jgi:hypothetical protein